MIGPSMDGKSEDWISRRLRIANTYIIYANSVTSDNEFPNHLTDAEFVLFDLARAELSNAKKLLDMVELSVQSRLEQE